MKRNICIVLIVAMIFSSSMSFGTIADKLANHWADNLISRSFIAYYFPYLARDRFEKFDPNGPISSQDFTLSIASLFKDYGYTVDGIGDLGNLSRLAMLDTLGAKLVSIGVGNYENVALPFKDIDKIPSDSLDYLGILYSNKIIVGDSDSSFSPNRDLTQVEAVIILQRVKEVLENMNTIAFKTLGIVQSYNSQEELIMKDNEDSMLLTITKQFPTPGYSMAVNRIMKEGNGYRIYFDISPPNPDYVQIQVITYKTITLEIDKNHLKQAPYNFILDGFNGATNS